MDNRVCIFPFSIKNNQLVIDGNNEEQLYQLNQQKNNGIIKINYINNNNQNNNNNRQDNNNNKQDNNDNRQDNNDNRQENNNNQILNKKNKKNKERKRTHKLSIYDIKKKQKKSKALNLLKQTNVGYQKEADLN
tara:strand:- start:2327 stop:2728 length:402 start_codon:yes stop_codon:yes gene_type:complete